VPKGRRRRHSCFPFASEVRIGHAMWFNPTTSGNHGSMAKREPQKQSAQATLAEIIEEMDKPRVAMSAREDHAVQRPFLKQLSRLEKSAPPKIGRRALNW